MQSTSDLEARTWAKQEHVLCKWDYKYTFAYFNALYMFLCEMMTPFGTPVDPLVYMMMAGSSGAGGVGNTSVESASFFPIEITSQNGVMTTSSRKPLVSVVLI